MQKLSIQLYPTIIAFKTQGPLGISKAVAPSLALGLITSELFLYIDNRKIKLIFI